MSTQGSEGAEASVENASTLLSNWIRTNRRKIFGVLGWAFTNQEDLNTTTIPVVHAKQLRDLGTYMMNCFKGNYFMYTAKQTLIARALRDLTTLPNWKQKIEETSGEQALTTSRSLEGM